MTQQLIVMPANEVLERFAALSESVQRIEKSLSIETQKPFPGERLVNKFEAAKILSCSVSTVDNLRRRGILTRVNVGKSVRFRLSEIEAIVSNKKDSNHE